MDQEQPSYRREFLQSPHHAWMGMLTVGLGFLSANPLALIVGATAYALGWIYLPDFPWFKKWVNGRREQAKRATALAEVAAFKQRRQSLLNSLSQSRRERYSTLVGVCQTIEAAGLENPLTAEEANTDPRLRKLDELMWTYLRLLTIEESLERFLEIERREELPKRLSETEAETGRLKSEIAALQSKGGASALGQKQRLLESRTELLEVLGKRLQRIEQARENLALVVSEQDRLDQQIKLIRADAVANKNAAALTARIDATVEQLDQTNKWISEMNEFKDLLGDVPMTEMRLGFNPVTPPPILTPHAQNRKTPGPIQQRQ